MEYYGKKGMSLMGAMEMQWVKNVNAAGELVEGFQYSVTNYICKGYAGQDNVQVASLLEIIINEVQQKHKHVSEIILQSDNATCLRHRNIYPFCIIQTRNHAQMENQS